MNEKLLLHTEDLAVGYEGKAVVENVNTDVHEGEIVTLIGPNGAGKSTILKTVGGLIPRISGKIYIDGKEPVYASGEMARTMAVLLTDRIHAEYMSAAEVVAGGRYPYTGRLGILRDKDYEAVDRAMEIIGVDELADENFNHLSDGQKQRVMLARALCQEPKLMLLDEPTSYLDIGYKIELLGKLRELADERGIGVIMTMHDYELARNIADTVVSVKDGRTERSGDPKEMLKSDHICSLFGVDRDRYDRFFGA